MPTPVFAFRLSKETQEALAFMAKVYGAPNPRAFARELLEVTCSGDFARIGALNKRLMDRLPGQLALMLEPPVAPQKQPQKALKAPKRSKGRQRRARPT